MTTWLRLIARACASVLEAINWAHAFAGDGFGEEQMRASRFVLARLDPRARLPAADTEPSAGEPARILPSGCRVAAATWLQTRVPAPRATRIPRSLPPAQPGDRRGAMRMEGELSHRGAAAAENVRDPLPGAGGGSCSHAGPQLPQTPPATGPWTRSRTGGLRRHHAAAAGSAPTELMEPPERRHGSSDDPISRRTRSRTFAPGSASSSSRPNA